MKIGRRYIFDIPTFTCAAVQDLIQFNGVAGLVYRIICQEIWCTDTSLATGQDLYLRSQILPATVTNGSGGTGSLTPAKTLPGDAACSSTGNFRNNTTRASTNGTAVTIFDGGCHLYQGHYKNYELEHACPTVVPSTAFVFSILAAPSGTVNLAGRVILEEIG